VGYDHYELDETLTSALDKLIAQLEADPSLFDPDQLRKRFDALDALDAYFGIWDTNASPDRTHILARTNSIRTKLESANAAIYNSIRHQIQQRTPPSQLQHWIDQCTDDAKTTNPGLAYDVLDELISGVLQSREPEPASLSPQPEMVFYQPTPARHILQLIRLSALSPSDTLIDLGSGLGHVPILASILTGAACIGIEAEPAYVESARACARDLRLNRVTFIHQNAIDANLAGGTVFYLYTPFTGSTLKTVLQRLQIESAERRITLCTLGPCTPTVAAESWLTSSAAPDPDQITLFRSSP
jgi:hypothetical protein